MASTKNENDGMLECCGHNHSKKSLMFGITVLIVGLMLQNKYSIPDILVVVGGILIIKSVLMMVVNKDK